MDEIVESVQHGDGHRDMAERAYTDIVASGRYGYQAFVQTILEAVGVGARARRVDAVSSSAGCPRGSGRSTFRRGGVRVRQRVRPMAREALRRVGLLDPVMQARSDRRARRLGER